jgi:hypothetical protein
VSSDAQPPPGLLVGSDPQAELADKLVGEQRAGVADSIASARFGECFSGAALVYVGGLCRLTRAAALHHELERVQWDHDSSTKSQRREVAADQFVGECAGYPE